jgi:cytochrome b6-f complex iron-sulfur subunit
MEPIEIHGRLSRRKVMVAGAGTALGVSVVTACGSDDDSPTRPDASPSSHGAGSEALAKVADVPVGGAVSATAADDKPVIVSRPTEGKVVAFSAVCTHQGCTVAPEGDILKCPCHGSTFDLATGDNTGGPAPSPLTEIPVRIEKGEVVTG